MEKQLSSVLQARTLLYLSTEATSLCSGLCFFSWAKSTHINNVSERQTLGVIKTITPCDRLDCHFQVIKQVIFLDRITAKFIRSSTSIKTRKIDDESSKALKISTKPCAIC